MEQKSFATLLAYLLDTTGTNDAAYNVRLIDNNNLFMWENHQLFSHLIKDKFQFWLRCDCEEKEKSQMEDDGKNSRSQSISNSDTSSDEDEQSASSSSSSENERNTMINKSALSNVHMSNYYDQCKRLLYILYKCQQYEQKYFDIYLGMIARCIKSDVEKLIFVAYEMIILHLHDSSIESKTRIALLDCLPRKESWDSLSESHISMLEKIHSISSIDSNIKNLPSTDELDLIFACKEVHINAYRDFRDCSNYLIDGDSLVISMAHHYNVDLVSFQGNNIHPIFLIERFIVKLLKLSPTPKLTIIFFDCNYECYHGVNGILDLIRSSLFVHLSRNVESSRSFRLERFSDWLSPEYDSFMKINQPHMLVYQDVRNLFDHNDKIIPKPNIEQLDATYRVYANYHQYQYKCGLYLLNAMKLSDCGVDCFRMSFQTTADIRSWKFLIRQVPKDEMKHTSDAEHKKSIEALCKNIQCHDVRLFFYLFTLKQWILESKQDQLDLLMNMSSFLFVHVALLIRLSISDRHISRECLSPISKSEITLFIENFQKRLSNTIASISSMLSYDRICDLFDGKLFYFTLNQLYNGSSEKFIPFDPETKNILSTCLNFIGIESIDTAFKKAKQTLIELGWIPLQTNFTENFNQPHEKHITFKISNQLIDRYLESYIKCSPSSNLQLEEATIDSYTPYKLKHHWNSYKEVGNQIERIRADQHSTRHSRNHRFRTRNQQNFYNYFKLYGDSLLTGEKKDSKENIKISSNTCSSIHLLEIETDEKSKTSEIKSRKGSEAKLPSKKELIIQENLRKMSEKRENQEAEQFNTMKSSLKQIHADDYFKALKMINTTATRFETITYRCELLELKFTYQRKYLKSFRKESSLTDEKQTELNSLMISYFATLNELVQLKKDVNPFESQQKYMEELLDKSPVSREDWYRFQLEKVNSYLPRQEQGIPDKRIIEFVPDPWQIKFLDGVDERQSIIIVAPTASGKTYACYYAMDRVLKDTTEPNAICVYVAPTKALVNQVAATIYSKFGPVFGVFTRDYRMNIDKCRILVTLPQCLEILLLSPAEQRWCQRIKYVIFDEIHCMSGEEDTEVWERAILLINCPMIALSATVNNAEELRDWIEHIEEKRAVYWKHKSKKTVSLIIHNERMADLNKSLYSNKKLYPCHSIGFINSEYIIERGLPSDFTLSPFETMQLTDSINQSLKENKVHQNSILPTFSEYFHPNWLIDRDLVNVYTKKVREHFEDLVHNDNEQIIKNISCSLNPISTRSVEYPEAKNLNTQIMELVTTLKEKDLLPCIVFTDKRSKCEELAESLVEYYKQRETELRETKYKQQIERLDRKIKWNNQRSAKKIKKKNSANSNCEEDGSKKSIDRMQVEAEEEQNSSMMITAEERQLLEGVLPECSLIDQNGFDKDLVEKMIKRVSREHPRLTRMMKRGIAYHHAGLNNRGRVAVEALFRTRYIQIIFSTATLALGVHMPTKTVAFVGDSIYLDALYYRQMSGRAGRRGFDIQGQVIFVDIPVSKIRHLIQSAIPVIRTSTPISVLFILRLLNLYSNADDKRDAVNRCLVSLECPFNNFLNRQKKFVDIQTRFLCLYSCDLLYKLNLIDNQGKPIGLSGLVQHLSYHSASSMVLAFLIAQGFFHEIKSETDLVNILCHLFTKFFWLRDKSNLEKTRQLRKKEKFNSLLFLPSVPNKFLILVEKYNELVMDVYSNYIDSVARRMLQLDEFEYRTLPLSKICFNEQSDYDSGTFEYYLHHHYSEQSKYPAITPFAGPSGLKNKRLLNSMCSISEPSNFAYDMNLSSQIIPLFDFERRDHMNTAYLLNSYALDFFKIGSEKLLIDENRISVGETFNSLTDFHLVLKSIETSLEVIIRTKESMEDENIFTPLYNSFKDISNIFEDKYRKAFPGSR